MLNRFRLGFACTVGALPMLLMAAPALATTVVYERTEELFADADAVIVGHVWTSTIRGGAVPHDEFEVEVLERFKGSLKSGAFVLVRTPGAIFADGSRVDVAGSPKPELGSQSLFFLRRLSDGAYGVLGLSLGHFSLHYDAAAHRYIAHRNLGAMVMLGADKTTRTGRVVEPADRTATEFFQELRGYAKKQGLQP